MFVSSYFNCSNWSSSYCWRLTMLASLATGDLSINYSSVSSDSNTFPAFPADDCLFGLFVR